MERLSRAMVAAGLLLALAWAAPSPGLAPVPPPKPLPPGNRIDDLSLRLEMPRQLGAHSGVCQLTLVNHAGRARTIDHFPTLGADYWPTPAVTFVVRFRTGDIFETHLAAYLPAELGSLRRLRPSLAIPAAGLIDRRSGWAVLSTEDRAVLAYRSCKVFCVTAIVDSLKLKSNTVFVGGWFPLEKGYDPFADARAFRRLEEKRKAEQRRARERAR